MRSDKPLRWRVLHSSRPSPPDTPPDTPPVTRAQWRKPAYRLRLRNQRTVGKCREAGRGGRKLHRIRRRQDSVGRDQHLVPIPRSQLKRSNPSSGKGALPFQSVSNCSQRRDWRSRSRRRSLRRAERRNRGGHPSGLAPGDALKSPSPKRRAEAKEVCHVPGRPLASGPKVQM
jgi:hypothetical protein